MPAVCPPLEHLLQFLTATPLTVLKLGGSLFDLHNLGPILCNYINSRKLPNPVVIPGGGRFADVVRHLDKVQQLNDQVSHQLGVRTLSITARYLAALDPQLKFSLSGDDCLNAWGMGSIAVLDVAELVLEHSALPESWDVTTDSVAAWVTSLNAESQLILLKSIPQPDVSSLEELAELGGVDNYFPIAARTLHKIDWCDFRSEQA